MSNFWDIRKVEKENRLIRLWSFGTPPLSAAKIAVELSSEYNAEITKNMVIGKVRRMGLAHRRSPLPLTAEKRVEAIAKAMRTRAARALMSQDERIQAIIAERQRLEDVRSVAHGRPHNRVRRNALTIYDGQPNPPGAGRQCPAWLAPEGPWTCRRRSVQSGR